MVAWEKYIFHLALFFILSQQNFIFMDVIGFKLGKTIWILSGNSISVLNTFSHICVLT